MFDITKLSTVDGANEGRDCTIKNPFTGKDTDFVITCYGADSKVCNDAKTAMAKKLIEYAKKHNLNENDSIPSEVKEQVGAEYLADMTKTWKNGAIGKKKLEPNWDNYVMVYKMSPIIREQIDLFISHREHFLAVAVKN